jgi:PAT family beta-lactamase induction signal transducer AmpG
MVKPFWVDRGFSQEEIGAVSTTLGALATIAGAVAGGTYVARRGIARALLVLGVFALASNLGYAAVAAHPELGRTGMYLASLAESFCGGLASAGFLAFLMRICEKDHAAVQYAGLTALYALPGTLAGAVSGWAVQLAGYAAYFAITALLAIPALLLVAATREWVGDES